jgi:predicted DNA-binding antitoxin AbrB/MazE fold protein
VTADSYFRLLFITTNPNIPTITSGTIEAKAGKRPILFALEQRGRLRNDELEIAGSWRKVRLGVVMAVDAVYEHGALRLLEPVELSEGQRVTVTIAADLPSSGTESPNSILDRIAAEAVLQPGDRFSGKDHDAVLYGGR